MKAAIYARVSTKNQKEEGSSLETQIMTCLKCAKERGCEVSQEFIFAEDWTGADLDRPKLNLVRRLIKEKQVDALICYSTDRLARNAIHLSILAEECLKRKVELLFVTEPLDTSKEGQLLCFVKGYAADLEREKIKDRTMRGKRARAEKGKLPTGGMGLYGFHYIKGKGEGQGIRVINQDAADIVKMIFHWRSEGNSYRSVGLKLMDLGIPAPKGGSRWSPSTIRRILKNFTYTGKTYACRMMSVEPLNGNTEGKRYSKTRRELRSREEWLELPNATPTIIDQRLFNEAQEVTERIAALCPRHQKYDYLLKGFIFCRRCGRRYYGDPQHGYRAYRCSARRAMPPSICGNPTISAAKLEVKVWEEIKRVLLNPELLISEIERRKQEQEEPDFLLDNLNIVNRRLEGLRNRETRLVRLYTFAEIDDELWKSEKARIETERRQLEPERDKLYRQLEARRVYDLDAEAIEQYCQRAAQNIEQFTFEEKRLALEALQVKVWVDGSNISIAGYIPVPERGILCQHS